MNHTKRIKRNVSGVLLLDKPTALSSNTALQAAKRLFQAAKAGHTGNLDPIATGLLPICFGEATKFAQYPTDADKVYEAEIQLGSTTSTGDREGEVLSQQPVSVTPARIETVLRQFIGTIKQIPPMHSALKHQGQPLYHYARKGIEIERAPREVQIHHIDFLGLQADRLLLRVACSKGTYIRVLSEDIGAMLGCGAHLTELRRTQVGRFTLSEAVTLEALDKLDIVARDTLLLPSDILVDMLKPIQLLPDAAHYFRHGQAIWLPQLRTAERYRIYDEKQLFMGVGQVNEDGRLAPVRLIVEPPNPGGETAAFL